MMSQQWLLGLLAAGWGSWVVSRVGRQLGWVVVMLVMQTGGRRRRQQGMHCWQQQGLVVVMMTVVWMVLAVAAAIRVYKGSMVLMRWMVWRQERLRRAALSRQATCATGGRVC
jgi:hypothetical protein